ncbi:MAG: hypothetical protein KF713_06505 [Turneriella sp.]|nr:hypothetical protein [Turneriella sp.]
MKHRDISPARPTSVTMRSAIRATLKDAQTRLSAGGMNFSEQRLMRECLRLALRFWRGRRGMASRSRRYNARSGPYEIAPFYSTEALRQVSMLRCHHSGISLSRLMDFAVRHYLARVVESWLSVPFIGRDMTEVEFWKSKYAKRRHPHDFIITYASKIMKNEEFCLAYAEEYQIKPWPPDLTPQYGR